MTKFPPPKTGPKILLFDIETAPIMAHVWGIWDQNVGLNMIHSDWHILSWSAKWLGAPAEETMYMDQRHAKNIEDDTKILNGIWKLLNECDIVVTQNGKSFDQKKLNARFIMQGLSKPSPYRHIDTKLLAGKHFAFTSKKLEYMTDKLNTKFKKLKHAKFSGFELWKQCLAGNIEAWNEMETYNKYDVLSLEELYNKLIAWDSSVNFSVYHKDNKHHCTCGSTDLVRRGYAFTNSGKYQRYLCTSCGAWTRSKINLLSDVKKLSLKAGV